MYAETDARMPSFSSAPCDLPRRIATKKKKLQALVDEYDALRAKAGPGAPKDALTVLEINEQEARDLEGKINTTKNAITLMNNRKGQLELAKSQVERAIETRLDSAVFAALEAVKSAMIVSEINAVDLMIANAHNNVRFEDAQNRGNSEIGPVHAAGHDAVAAYGSYSNGGAAKIASMLNQRDQAGRSSSSAPYSSDDPLSDKAADPRRTRH